MYQINASHSVHFGVLKTNEKSLYSHATGHINEPWTTAGWDVPRQLQMTGTRSSDLYGCKLSLCPCMATVYRSPILLSSVNGDRVPKAHFSFLWTRSPVNSGGHTFH